jgi:hypothetical protein
MHSKTIEVSLNRSVEKAKSGAIEKPIFILERPQATIQD